MAGNTNRNAPKLKSAQRISVIVISRNEGSDLRMTVENLEDTLPANAEIVVVDDGSTDKSADYLARRRGRVRLFRSDGRGVAKSRVFGAQQATGDVFFFCDAHLGLDPLWWQPMVEQLENPAVGAVAPAIAKLPRSFAANLLNWLGEAGLVLCGGLLVALTLAVALLLDHWALFILVGMALGLGYFMLHGVMQARASELAPEARATAVSLFILMLFLGQGLGAVLMASAITVWGYYTAFLLAVSGNVLLTVWLANHIRRTAMPDAG